MLKVSTILIVAIGLAGCHGEAQEGPLFNKNLLLPTAPAPAGNDAATGAVTAPNSTATQTATTDGSTTSPVIVPSDCSSLNSPITKDNRNLCIWALISIIDNKYYSYRAGLKSLATTSGAIFDVLSLGLSTAATATGGAAAKTVLSAINTGITGTKTALDSDYLYNKSIDIVTNQMDADRNEQFTNIIKQMQVEPSAYGMTQAKDDLLRYYEAGTFTAALESLVNKTGSNASACQAAADTAKRDLSAGTSTSGADASKCNPTSSAGGATNQQQPQQPPAQAPVAKHDNPSGK